MQRARLLLMRHAKSSYPQGVPDHERPLSARGESDAQAAKEWFLGEGAQLIDAKARVFVSSALRVQQTWQIVSPALPTVSVQQAPTIYEAAVSTLVNLCAPSVAEGHDTLLVGHNPGLEQLADFLGDDDRSVQSWRIREKYPTCAIVVLEFDDDSWSIDSARVSSFVIPRG